MTKEQINEYLLLTKEFNDSADRVAKYFAKVDCFYDVIDSWSLDFAGHVEGVGTETWSHGGREDYYVVFDSKWLYATDEELQNHVDLILKEKAEKEKSAKEAELNKEKEERYKEYLKLKEEFGD